MAESGDAKSPTGDTPDIGTPAPAWPASERPASERSHDLDDLIGFTSPSSLAGRERPTLQGSSPPEPRPEPAVEPEDESIFVSKPEPEPEPQPEPIVAPEEPVFVAPPPLKPAPPEPEPDLFDFRPRTTLEAAAARDRSPASVPAAEPVPAWAVETPAAHPAPPPVRKAFGRAGEANAAGEPPEGAMGLYTIYALILFAVPTLGASALVALLAIYGRAEPRQPLALSHHIFQKRTLFIAAITAALGVVLIAVNLGVFVLFLLALWVLVRGAFGLLKLSGNRSIPRPRHWLI